jgi:hypothetical protein
MTVHSLLSTPPQIPEQAQAPLTIARCGFCGHTITLIKGQYRSYWATSELPTVVALVNECPARPRPGMGPGAFDSHVPAPKR